MWNGLTAARATALTAVLPQMKLWCIPTFSQFDAVTTREVRKNAGCPHVAIVQRNLIYLSSHECIVRSLRIVSLESFCGLLSPIVFHCPTQLVVRQKKGLQVQLRLLVGMPVGGNMMV